MVNPEKNQHLIGTYTSMDSLIPEEKKIGVVLKTPSGEIIE